MSGVFATGKRHRGVSCVIGRNRRSKESVRTTAWRIKESSSSSFPAGPLCLWESCAGAILCSVVMLGL